MEKLKDTSITKITLKDVIDILLQYEVRQVECIGNRMTLYGQNDNFFLGICDNYNREILIEKNLSPDTKRLTLLHELHHGYHNLKGDLYGYNNKVMESIVDRDSKLQTKELYKK
jgi:Zn-dependent peptidase ImmA (M78 family)